MDDQVPAQDPSYFYALLGRALTDDEFRRDLMNKDDRDQQIATLRKVGITANQPLLDELNNSIDAINKLASAGGFGADVAAVT